MQDIAMMDYLQCAASMNNMAVLRLLFGDRRGAFDLFKGAFDAMNEGVTYCTKALPAPFLPPHGFPHFNNTALPFVPIGDSDFHPSSIPEESKNSGDENVDGFTFDKTFLFNPRVKVTVGSIEACKAAVLFNLALLYHQRDKYYYDRYEDTALELYNSCLELLRRPSAMNCSNVVIAALNNKAQIFYERHDLDTTSALLRELGNCLGKAIDEAGKSLSEQDINRLLLNVHCQRALICAPGA